MKCASKNVTKTKSLRYFSSVFLCASLIFCMNGFYVSAQTLLTGLKNEIKRADDHYKQKEFKDALTLYQNAEERGKQIKGTRLQIARCHYYLNDFKQCVHAYQKYMMLSEQLLTTDILKYAEALRGTNNYPEAIKWYTKYLDIIPDDALIKNNIWRLKNIKYLYEDSAYYIIRPININTLNSELCPVMFKDHLVYMSNPNTFKPSDHRTAYGTSFYKLYTSKVLKDSLTGKVYRYEKPELFCKLLKAKYHEGPISFYDDYKKIVYTKVSSKGGNNNPNREVLQLYFAERNGKKWSLKTPFPYNSNDYSVCQPSISTDGKTLYFSSDMKGGFGNRDLYKSEYINGQWSKPKNLGNEINTAADESFPYIHNQTTLYFSSNGHAGFGGFDIHKVEIIDDKIGEIQNLGYPVNTSYDDFGITLNAEGSHGYLSSNRKQGGLDDDIYELDINIQSYPLLLSGFLKYKMSNWKDSSSVKVLPNTKLYVIDNVKNIIVHSGLSDENGHFSISIPYFSRYRIRVIESDGSETTVSLDISKQRKTENNHEIVIVKDIFKSKSKR